MRRHIILHILILYSGTMFFNCAKKVHTISELDTNNGILPDSIIFFQFQINADSTSPKSEIELMQWQVVKGKLKSEERISGNSNKIKITLQGRRTLKEIVIDHPLFKDYEYLDGNELKKKRVDLSTAIFYVRTSWNPSYEKIKLTEFREFGKPLESGVFELNR